MCRSFDNPLRRWVQNPIHILQPHVSEGMRVLDLGCGMGYFSLAMAKLVGETGRVVAVDLQKKMLDGLRARAVSGGLMERIDTHQCTPAKIGIEESINFALGFWMVHEITQPDMLLTELYEKLAPGGRFLMVEPKIHVPKKQFFKSITLAERLGFQVTTHPNVSLSRTVLFTK